jgi:hypothetical protein
MTAPDPSLHEVIARCLAMVKLRSRKEVIAYGAGPDVITAIDKSRQRVAPPPFGTPCNWRLLIRASVTIVSGILQRD